MKNHWWGLVFAVGLVAVCLIKMKLDDRKAEAVEWQVEDQPSSNGPEDRR